MKTHTNGPWTIGDDCCVYGNHGMIRPFVAQIADDYNDGETQANARLIAAAPDLLEAADDALADLEGYEFAAETIRKLRAAIAKATGETL
jgi:hypothetical protein